MKILPFGFLPGEKPTLGDRLLMNALRRKVEAWETYRKNPTKDTQKKFLEAVDHMNHLKENV